MNNKVNFEYYPDRIKEYVSIEDALRHYAPDSMATRKGTRIKCPSPNHADKNPSAVISHKGCGSGSCHCFSCGGSWDAIKLVMEVKDLRFPQACEQLIQDFGLDKYQCSNLADWEASRRTFAKSSFVDSFPLTPDKPIMQDKLDENGKPVIKDGKVVQEPKRDEFGELVYAVESPCSTVKEKLAAVGLHDTRRIEMKYAVSTEDYFMAFFGEIPPNAPPLVDANGNKTLMDISRHEAVEMGLLEPLYREVEVREYNEEGKVILGADGKAKTHIERSEIKEEYIETPDLATLWKDDKAGVESMIIDKAQERLQVLKDSIEGCKFLRAVFERMHSPAERDKLDKLRDYYIQARVSGKCSEIPQPAKQAIEDLYLYEDAARQILDFERECRLVERIYGEVIDHQAEREKHSRMANQQKSWQSHR